MVLGKQARKITEDEAMSCVGGYCLALDMTARLAKTIIKKQYVDGMDLFMVASGIFRMRQRRKATPGLLPK